MAAAADISADSPDQVGGQQIAFVDANLRRKPIPCFGIPNIDNRGSKNAQFRMKAVGSWHLSLFSQDCRSSALADARVSRVVN
jgi:hypothetical protein